MKSRFLLLSVLVCGSASFLSAGSYSYTALVDGSSTWNRPVENGVAAPVDLSLTALNAGYHAQSIVVDTNGTYSFESDISGSFWDNYTFLFENAFDANAPLANILIGNDDGLIGLGNSGFVYNLIAGVTYFFVTTGFSDSDLGTATNVVSGPGFVGEAPEPATFLIGAAGLGLLALGKKLKQQV